MKLFEKIFTLAAAVSVLMSCAGETLSPDQGLGTADPSLTDTDFRGCIDVVNRKWVRGEKAWVYDNVSTSPSEYVVGRITSDGDCILTGKVYNTAELYYALYPASAFDGLSDGKAVLKVPAAQVLPHRDSTKAAIASPAVAMTHLKEFDFVSVASYISFDVDTDAVKSLTLSSMDDNAPAGTVTLDVADGKVVSSTGDGSVTLSAKDGFLQPGLYYVQVKPGDYPAGLDLVVGTDDSQEILVDVRMPDQMPVGKTVHAGSIKSPFRSVKVSEVAFSSAKLDWVPAVKAESYNIYINDVKKVTLSGDAVSLSLTSLPTGEESTVRIEAVTSSGLTASKQMTVKTKDVYQFTRSTGTSFLCIGWDAPIRQEVHGYTQAYQIQVWADQAMTKKVYDFVPEGGGNSTQEQLFGNGSYYGKTQLPQGPNALICANYLTPTKVSVGGFYPGTTYYVRVRTLASFVQANGVELAHPWGDTEWSDLIPMTTDAPHSPAEGEIIYGGFNDMCIQTDLLNSCLGAKNATTNSAIAWDKRTPQLFYFYVNNHGQHQADSFGLASSGKRIDGSSTLEGYSGCAIHVGNTAGTGNTYIGDMAGWVWAAWTRPMMGGFGLDGAGTFVATPALTSDKLSAEGTDCTLTFKASLRIRITDTYTVADDGVAVQVWRAAKSEYEQIKTFKTSEILPFDVTKDTATEVLNDYGRNTLTCDLKLYPGDNVEIVAKRNGYIILDDILVVKK